MKLLLVVVVALAGCGKVAGQADPDASIDGAPGRDAVDAPTCAPSPAGLVSRWRGEMNADDDTGAHGGKASGTIAYAAGKHGFAFLLDGTDAITIDDGDAMWIAGSFSVEAWVNTTTGGVIASKYECGNFCPTGQATSYWYLGTTGDGHPVFETRPAQLDHTSQLIDTLHAVHDQAWHHLVAVHDVDGKRQVIYVDGTLAVSAPLADPDVAPLSNTDGETDPVVIGGLAVAGGPGIRDFHAAAIDDVAFYAAALTADDVRAQYQAPDGACK
jgi:concanavalin A-like lectin/glucanase superfamily protein